MGWSAACEPITLFARWAFLSEKKNNMGWSAAFEPITILARWAFFSENNNIHNIGWCGVGGRMALVAR